MNASAAIAVSVVFVIGTAIGVASFTGVIELPSFGSSETGSAASDGDVNNEDGDLAASDSPDAKTSEEEDYFAKIEQYLKDNPQDRKGAQKYGGTLVDMGEFDRAERFYKSRLSTHPKDSDFLYGLGWTYEKSKQWSNSVEYYKKAIEANSKHIAANNNLAWVLATAPDESVRNGKRAVKLAKQAMRLAGEKGLFAADTLAAALAETGDFESAVEVQRWVVTEAPEEEKDDLRERLKLYLQNQPYRLD